MIQDVSDRKRTYMVNHILFSSFIISILFVMLLFKTAAGFGLRSCPSGRIQRLSMSSDSFHLVLLRHGESTWNDENKFTGWYDCPLSAKGEMEAISAGKLLNAEKFKFDLAYTSFLQRAIKTLWHSLEQTGQMYIPIKNSWQLNERCL